MPPAWQPPPERSKMPQDRLLESAQLSGESPVTAGRTRYGRSPLRHLDRRSRAQPHDVVRILVVELNEEVGDTRLNTVTFHKRVNCKATS